MMIPSVHLNGTGKQSLLDELETAYRAMAPAIEALQQVTVHGRDYYVQGPDAYSVARREMDTRLAALEQVKTDLFDLYVAVQKQGK